MAAASVTPMEFLLGVMRSDVADPKMRLEAAKAAAGFIYRLPQIAEAASAKLKGSNEVTSDPVGPLLASYVERLEYVMRSRALPPGAGRASTLPRLHLMVEPRHRCGRRRLRPAP